jgi:hypothetical protein
MYIVRVLQCAAVRLTGGTGMATGYWLDCRGSIAGGGKRSFSSPQHPDRVLFPRGYSGRGADLIIHLDLVPRSRIVELYLHSRYFFVA